MVKLDLEINEIVGLAELGKISEKKLKKFLKAATKEELEDYIIQSVSSEGDEEESESQEEEPEEEEKEKKPKKKEDKDEDDLDDDDF